MYRIFWILILGGLNTAHADYLAPDQAFRFQATSISQDHAELTWQIADGYYLYHDQFKVRHDQEAIKLNLPTAQDKDDPTFGMTKVHYDQVKTLIKVEPNQSFNVQWQGCAESGLCYPVQRMSIQTGEDGLLPASQGRENKQLFGAQPNASMPLKPIESVEKIAVPQASIQITSADQTLQKEQQLTKQNQEAILDINAQQDQENTSHNQSNKDEVEPVSVENSVLSSEISVQDDTHIQPVTAVQSDVPKNSFQSQRNNDQFFFGLLSSQGVFINILVFVGLGILLAFLPCSLPLIPILSSILVQRQKGYRAAMVAGAFVLGLALVYALMGFAVSQLGYNFQRWFQNPIFIGLFALLFILFALNLFGAFQLSLPQNMLQYLDQWQQKQKGGTLIGAFIMGMIAALIVGPCMSAPLAGALLFVSQLNQPVMGTLYLFLLGIGMGLPIFIAAVFGANYLPKPGLWMDRLKFSFGFVMLALAVYFMRPLIASVWYFALLSAILLLLAGYCMAKILPDVSKKYTKMLLVILSLVLSSSAIWYAHQAITQIQMKHATQLLSWQKVTTAMELDQALTRAAGQAVVIDVYADWCVACQPIEHEVLPREDVQAALSDVFRIKLDLTTYHPSQDEILKEWQILGPPTMIMLNNTHQEQRKLRLTGTFSASQFITYLTQLEVTKN